MVVVVTAIHSCCKQCTFDVACLIYIPRDLTRRSCSGNYSHRPYCRVLPQCSRNYSHSIYCHVLPQCSCSYSHRPYCHVLPQCSGNYSHNPYCHVLPQCSGNYSHSPYCDVLPQCSGNYSIMSCTPSSGSKRTPGLANINFCWSRFLPSKTVN